MKIQTKFFAFALAAVVSLFLAIAAVAQTQTTGTLEGVVTDQAGAVVPAITVTLSGGSLLRPQTATTDSNGYYRFNSVPPGRYTVDVAAAKGFGAYKQDNVEVNLAKGSTANIALTVAGTGATVDVVATPDIDQSTNVQ